MSRPRRPTRYGTDRRCLPFERLEPRCLPSLAVVATVPAPGARLTSPPTSLTVKFNAPIDPTSLSLSDVQLDRVGGGGGLEPVDGVVEAPGTDADQLALTPDHGLGPGHYRMVLAGGSGLLSAD